MKKITRVSRKERIYRHALITSLKLSLLASNFFLVWVSVRALYAAYRALNYHLG